MTDCASTHYLSLDDWDSDEEGPDDCQDCSAELNENGLCWFCDRNWIWSGP